KEPPRGCFESSSAKTVSATRFAEALRILLSRKTFVQLVIAYSLGLFASYGLGQWLPTFFVRIHNMSLTKVGFWLGLTLGTGSVFGTALGGFAARRLIEKDRRWEIWFVLVSYAVCIPIYALVFIVPNANAALALTFLGGLAASLGIGPGMAAVQTVIEANLRATAIAIIMFFSALLGQGGGPLVIGILSDLLSPVYGENSLRVALLFSLLILGWSLIHFHLAAKSIREEIVA
ncbi:MAG: MFS transporter, partial [Deltaproteobacteria bacterium]|nr:MFS transporter [Deltaproteobacteria bacterium]